MKNRKMRLVIGMLIGLVIFSSSVALLMYTKIGKEENKSVASVEVYVATTHLKRGDIIKARDIKKSSIPKSYLSFTPLMDTEIVGRYARVDIFAQEPMRKEKLSINPPVKKTVETAKAVVEEPKVIVEEKIAKDTITVSLSVFKNIDSSLKKGDLIDIVSVFSKNAQSSYSKYKTRYVALSVPISSFVSNSTKVDSYITRGKDSVTVADSIVFEMQPDEIAKFLSVYYETQELNAKRVLANKGNRGHLWMVKCSTSEDLKVEKTKERMMVDHKKKVIQRKRASNPVSISYEH